MRKPILLAASLVAAVTILLVALFAALNPSGSAKGTARIPIFPLTSTSTVTSTPTGTSTAVVTTTSTVDPDISAIFPNPGFEDGFTGWTLSRVSLTGTTNYDEDYSGEIDHTVKHSGTASAHIWMPNLGYEHQPKYYARIGTYIPADIFRGKRIRLSVYMRTQELALSAGLWLNVPGVIDGKPTDPDIPMVWDATANKVIVSGTADWRKVDIVLDIPEEASYLEFGVTTGQFGHLWIDDMQLEVVGSDVPTTHRNASLIKATNLDFEQGLTNWITSTSSSGQSEYGAGPEMAHSGRCGAYLKYFGSSDDERAGLTYDTIYGQFYRDKKVSISAYVNMDKAPKGVSLYLEALYLDGKDPIGSTVTNTVQLLPSASGAQGWQRIEGTIDVPDRTWGLVLALALNGDGEVWIDDVQIDILGPADPTHTPR